VNCNYRMLGTAAVATCRPIFLHNLFVLAEEPYPTQAMQTHDDMACMQDFRQRHLNYQACRFLSQLQIVLASARSSLFMRVLAVTVRSDWPSDRSRQMTMSVVPCIYLTFEVHKLNILHYQLNLVFVLHRQNIHGGPYRANRVLRNTESPLNFLQVVAPICPG
jgi:hypothetical protein